MVPSEQKSATMTGGNHDNTGAQPEAARSPRGGEPLGAPAFYGAKTPPDLRGQRYQAFGRAVDPLYLSNISALRAEILDR